jgi:tetratricopeptide (TPR) repeat protein
MEEKLLVQCAASITALWHLLKGSELALVEQTLSTYLLNLVLLARKPSPYQKTAARLASQGYRLSGIVALHHNNLQAREQCCQQALLLSEIAEDTSLQVAARISLASTFYYRKDPTQASQTYQQALQHKDQIPPLQRSRVYAELAVAYAQQREEQEALRALGLARELYPEYPENDPSYLYAEFSPASFILEEGLTYLALAGHFPDQYYAQQAWEHFQHIETMRAERIVPDRIFYEITNRQAETALMLQDAELFQTYWERGITGATLLHSRQRYQEAAEIYEKATTAWPDEPSVKALQERLHLSA